MLSKNLKFILPLLVFFVIFFIFNLLSSWYENKLIKEENKVILSKLQAHRTSITESIDKRFVILSLLKNYVEKNIPEQTTFNLKNKDLNLYSKTLFNSVDGIKVLQVSPNGVHTFVYPLDGNQKTLNKNLFKDKRVSVIDALELTKKSKKIITNAPYKLTQGGFGLVARQAVREKDEFWGFVVMVLDMTYIFEQIGLTNQNKKYNFAIYQDDRFIFGEKSINHTSSHKIPLIIANQKLTLMAENKVSINSIAVTLILINSAILFIAILSAFIIYILLNRQVKLEHSVIKTMKELEKKNLELKSLIQEAPNPIILHKEGGEILMMNKSWVDSSGFTLEDTPTIGDWIEKTRDDEEIKLSMIKHIKSLYKITKKVDEGEFTFLNKNRDSVTWQVSSAPLGFIDGKKTIITSAMNVTELKEKERILLQQSKMAAMGEMLENIAHQWRQPLSTISTASTGMIVQKELDALSDHQLITYLNTINNSAQYLSSTIDDFRNFFKPSEHKVSTFKIDETLNKTVQLLDASFSAKEIEVVKDIKEIELLSIENELIQVLINILNNAKDALLKVENHKRLIFINVYQKGNIMFIEIKDNAEGVPENLIDKIFEPYFTTKHKAQGTGIGLYMSSKIVDNHLKGSLQVSNDKYSYEGSDYVGAKFTIKIPVN